LPTNLIRYSSTNGVSANSWPGNPNINLPGWQVIQTPGCLQPGFTPTPPVVDLGTDQILCNQGNILDAGNAGTGATYQWNTGATTQTITVTSPNTYTVHVTKACAITSDFITISTITAGNDLSTCPGDTVELPKSTTTAQWSGGNGNFIPSTDPAKVLYVVDPNDFGLYTLQVSVTSACGVATDEMVLRVGWEEQTTSQIFAQPTAPQVSEPISFSVNTPSSSILGNETWDFGDGSGPVLIDEATRINTHTYAAPGDYLVTFTFYAPCPYQLTLPITVTGELIIPNVFTPNGDQVNDVFNVELPGTKSYSLKIFNRWGQLQFESTDRSKGWDGKGSPDGVYFMSLEATLTDGSPFNVRQTVSLISGKE
jgi:gliding motility-associated-like protein